MPDLHLSLKVLLVTLSLWVFYEYKFRTKLLFSLLLSSPNNSKVVFPPNTCHTAKSRFSVEVNFCLPFSSNRTKKCSTKGDSAGC